ncbi:MAG: LytR family transcriptional regulator, partial [Mycobacterium sp.]|nr:LytR family transcriptional regulator [Mycobacterium sp.]
MNERVPDSTGLPLRAMVMVLLFLGVIFLLVGFQAMSSGGGDNTDDPKREILNADDTLQDLDTDPAARAESQARAARRVLDEHER